MKRAKWKPWNKWLQLPAVMLRPVVASSGRVFVEKDTSVLVDIVESERDVFTVWVWRVGGPSKELLCTLNPEQQPFKYVALVK